VRTLRGWQIALKRLFELTYAAMTETLQIPPETARDVLEQDFARSEQKGRPDILSAASQPDADKRAVANKRQKMSYAGQ